MSTSLIEQPGELQMQSPFTPGPWGVLPYSEGDDVIQIISGEPTYKGGTVSATWVAELDASSLEGGPGENEANARLIAAAPDMLAALNAIRVWMKNHDRSEHEQKIYDAIRVVIARAEGQ
jgi:hypothetical protein